MKEKYLILVSGEVVFYPIIIEGTREEAETVLKNAAKSYEGFKVELYKLQNPL